MSKGLALFVFAAALNAAEWDNGARFRLRLVIDMKRGGRSSSPAAVEVDFHEWLSRQKIAGTFDPSTVAVVPIGADHSRVAHRLEPYFGVTKVTLHFVIPNATCTNFAVYFDTVESGRGKPTYHGLVGDGDKMSQEFGRRETSVSHFDAFCDLDGDGDLDLFKGGVEPFVYCLENVGQNRFVERGRLTSEGQLFKLPCSRANRSWATVAFYDVDGDGDQDFFPSFGDGPDAGRIIFYRNSKNQRLTFTRIGSLQTISGVPLAGGAQAGGWFPSITFVADWDGDGAGPDALVGSNHRCWLYRNAGTNDTGAPQFADAVAIQTESVLTNPRFAVADIDADGDPDLFAATQPGPVHWFENTGPRTKPKLAKPTVVAWGGKYLIGDAHSGVAVADLDRDGLPDVLSGRFWQRADLNRLERQNDFGGFFKNTGAPGAARFERKPGPFTEQFQPCDAVRQNSVRATDWDNDGKLDLLAGDTDGFIWFFRNQGGGVFAAGERLRALSEPLSVAASGGHARLDVCDWDEDGKQDLVVADGGGGVTLFTNRGSKSKPDLAGGVRLSAGQKPIQVGGRASVLVCDWDNDGRKDLLLADDKGYYFCRNTGTSALPSLSDPTPVLFGGRKVTYVRPNLGSFVDWDGDGKKDLIGSHFENSIRFYRNIGSGTRGAEPEFANPEGVVILQGESPQMISGADALDWNGDGDIDILTGQGHGGSHLRFFERDWIEDEMKGTHPVVHLRGVDMKEAPR